MKAALGLVFPPQCPGCSAAVSAEGGLCPECWREAEFVGTCACGRCGAPLPGDGDPVQGDPLQGDPSGEALLCDDCIAVPRPWRRGRAALVYAGTGRRLVLALKHGDRPDLAPTLGGWLANAASPLVRPGMLVVPVPVHARRMLSRKYNQAALLGTAVARTHGLRHMPGALVRLRHTPMQDHGSVASRFANVAGAIAVPAGARPAVEGRAVLLVDDVMASGATLAAATDALREAGSGPVAVAVLARAVRDARPGAPDEDPG